MRVREDRRRVGVVVAGVGMLLLAGVGCGADDGGSRAGGNGERDGGRPVVGAPGLPPEPVRPDGPDPGPPLRQEQLVIAMLTVAELPAGARGIGPISTVRTTAKQAECQALIDLMHPAQGAVAPKAAHSAAFDLPGREGVLIGELYTYDGRGAESVLAAGRRALAACPRPTSSDAEYTDTERYREVPYARIGDDSLAVHITDGRRTRGSVLVRVGSTLVRVTHSDTKEPDIRLPAEELVVRQVERVRAAAGS
ncbi:hypothetical protein GT354_29310 [Streptomyces sp. SID3343]|nr:hypothetical protein [Streptomyces sp. SID3343]